MRLAIFEVVPDQPEMPTRIGVFPADDLTIVLLGNGTVELASREEYEEQPHVKLAMTFEAAVAEMNAARNE